MKKIHLICNAHIDPVWQWDVAEGIGAALSTFRCAADFCDEYDYFVFNHNEALLYRLVEKYEPILFERIKKHVAAGRWHIMGGFELQPDCVMPQGETYIRQILRGRKYFEEKFGVYPTTAVNFDSFGHSRGIVQLLAKSGYDSYVFMRPENHKIDLPATFLWEGFDGSKIMAHRLTTGYNSLLGENAKEILEWYMNIHPNDTSLYTWGVGNHGGGPSRKDIEDINKLQTKGDFGKLQPVHSTPEAYFAEVDKAVLPVINFSLYSSHVGCYTSMLDIKQQHRRLENQLMIAEKIASVAFLNGMEYPALELDSAFEALAFVQFHDVLPGTMTYTAKKSMLAKLGYGLEIAANIINRAFYMLTAGQHKAGENTVPIMVYNPHPYPVETIISCEYMLGDFSWDTENVTVANVTRNGISVASQIEREESMIPLDWRKRIIFEAELPPMEMSRFDCHLEVISNASLPSRTGKLIFDNGEISLEISKSTGLIENLCYKSRKISNIGFGTLSVFADDFDPWHMTGDEINKYVGSFQLMKEADLQKFLNNQVKIPRVRIIENGDVRTVVEAIFAYEASRAIVRYFIPKKGRKIGLNIELINTLRDKMIKLALPVSWGGSKVKAETMFGIEDAIADGREYVSHRFDVITSNRGLKLGIINNCTYGGSINDGILYKNLIRSPAYCAQPIGDRQVLPSDRYVQRMEQGQSSFDFILIPGDETNGLYEFAKTAQILNEAPIAVSFFPPDYDGILKINSALSVTGDVTVTAVKCSEDGIGLIARIFEPVGNGSNFTLRCDKYDICYEGVLTPFEIKTFLITKGEVKETNLMER